MKGASWAAGTISTAPDIEVCNSQQQAREKKEKTSCRATSSPLASTGLEDTCAQRCGGTLMPISLLLNIRYSRLPRPGAVFCLQDCAFLIGIYVICLCFLSPTHRSSVHMMGMVTSASLLPPSVRQGASHRLPSCCKSD